MKKYLIASLLLLNFQLCFGQTNSLSKPTTALENQTYKEDFAAFTPPQGWMTADRSQVDLPPLVKIMVVGKSSSTFPPSMNLTSSPYQGTLKQYLQIVKNRNQQSRNEWKDLGMIKTNAGNASLSQVDSKTQWGDVRQMHVILVKNETVYILTAAALKTEFSLLYQDFFKAMQSLRVSSDPLEIIPNSPQKMEMKNEIKKLQLLWKSQINQETAQNPSFPLQEIKEKVFNSESFKNKAWEPLKEKLQKTTVDLGSEWQSLVLQNVKNELFSSTDEKKRK